jgi:PAS domain S-box-containing protein/diguanylate cyclase (GGDEF)-like protein
LIDRLVSTAARIPRIDSQGTPDFAAAILSLHSGILITDPSEVDNPIVFANPAFTEMTGYSAQDSVGRNCRFLQGPDTDQVIVSEIRDALAQGHGIRREVLNYRKDGTPFWTDLSISPTVDATGRVVGFVGFLNDLTARRQVESSQREAEAMLASIVENMPGFVFRRLAKPDGTFQYFSSSFGAATGASALREVTGQEASFAIHPDNRVAVQEEIAKSMATLLPSTLEFRVLRPGDEPLWLRTFSTSRRLHNGDTVSDGVGIDISREKASESRLSSIVENMPGYVFRRVRKPDGTVQFPYFSPAFARMLGLPEGAISTDVDLWKVMHPDDLAQSRDGFERSARDMSPLMTEARLIAIDGRERWFRSYSSPQRHSNGDVVWDGVGLDVTTEKEIELRLAYLVLHDPITGLANRSLLNDRLADAIRNARRIGDQVALSNLLIIDFSEISETLGADEGDSALKSIAGRMSELSGLFPNTTAARLGGAEFAILRHGEHAGDTANDFAETMVRSLARPIVTGKEALVIEPSVGTAILLPGELTELSENAAAAELMKRAAIALSTAARAGPGSHRFYDEELDHRIRHRMLLRHSLRTAIDEDQFQLHYQPVVDLRSGKIVSAEALIRWQHPQLGLLRPDLFISLAEESGLIGSLGEWVMRTAMRQTKAWEASGLKVPRIAINVSGTQIRAPDFVTSVREILLDTGSDPHNFELELTEGILIERSPEVLAVLVELKLLGFALVIDDFGAGHASFQYLRNFPIDKLKIDQMFVRQLVIGSSDALIIRAISSLAHGLKLGLVAEGIETVEQRDFLRDQGCSTAQGYFFSLPLTAEDFAWMIEKDVVLPVASKRH